MKAIKKLLDTTTKLIVAIALLAILLTWLILFFVAREMAIDLLKPLLWTLLIVAAGWIAIHFGVKAWRKRKRAEFDERVAAKEGIDDRRREWANWTAELEKRGIDRYELPFYLLVGEPQSGKSVLLHNSDLHFPFGQNRLSGVGGTRGCDWWFTEEAVILDLAGRLFTHEGGAADRLEFEAFLQLLNEFRPLCPANGVILVIPSDSLLKDSAEQCGAKATKIQNALLTLTTKLQAQVPVYLVITKGDQIFGFAESVHRLDVERRHQMFGWSRPADKLDSPFDLAEVVAGFEETVRRARLLRAHMLAGARLPEALPEVDRMYAFPHELQGMQPNLEIYLQRIFTASNITDRVFFRGLYLTSGLQSGVPIAKVCTELFGQAGEADMRNLEALFSKQRAYFIKDLIRNRVFGERGLVRPTQGRVQQTRRSALIGYGLSGAVVLGSVIFAAVYLLKGSDRQQTAIHGAAVEGAREAAKTTALPIPEVLYRLQQISDGAEREPEAYEEAFTDPRDAFKGLYCALFDARMAPRVKIAALDVVEAKLSDPNAIRDHAELRRVCDALVELLGDVDFSSERTREGVLGVLDKLGSSRTTVEGGEQLTLESSFDKRLEYGDGDVDGLLLRQEPGSTPRLVRLARLGLEAVERSLEPGARTQPGNELGYMLAWSGADQARNALLDVRTRQGRAIELCGTFSRSMQTLKRIEDGELQSGSGGKTIAFKDFCLQGRALQTTYRQRMVEFLTNNDSGSPPSTKWPRMDALFPFVGDKFKGHEGLFNLSSFGLHFGSEDLGQTLFQESESRIGMLTGEIAIPADHDPFKGMNDPLRLLEVSDKSLPADLGQGGLIGLAERIREVDGRVLGDKITGIPAEVFVDEVVELADDLPAQLPDVERALRVAPSAGNTGSLSVPLVHELAELHRALDAVARGRDLEGVQSEKVRKGQAHIEGLLDDHLRERGSEGEWLPSITADGTFPPEAWTVLDAFASAAQLELVLPERIPLATTAGDAQRGAFVALASQLVDRWRSRPPDLDQTVETVDELGLLAAEVAKRPGFKETLAGVDYDVWTDRVDSLLYERLDRMAQEIGRIWQVQLESGRPLRDVVNQARSELAAIAEKIRESSEFGMAGITAVLKKLEEGGPIRTWLPLKQTNDVLVDLRQWKIPESASVVQDHDEYKDLERSLTRLRDVTTGEGHADEFARGFATPPPDVPAANAGIRLVRGIRAQFAVHLRDEVRRSYLAALQELLEGNAYKDHFAMLFWEQGTDVSGYRDTDMQDALEKLLKKKGAFAALGELYKLTGPGAIGAQIFPAEAPASEDDWARVHRFLAGLSEFLLAGDEKGSSIKASKFNFSLIPDVGASESVWALGSLPADEKRDFFYYPENDSSEDLQKRPMGRDMGRLKVSNWGFDVSRPDRSLRMLWSKKPTQVEARSDPSAYRHEIPGCLAPLFLAWSGRPLDEDARDEFEVSLEPAGAKRPAPLKVQFDRPLPLRPAKP